MAPVAGGVGAMTHAARHRQMDVALAEQLARDGNCHVDMTNATGHEGEKPPIDGIIQPIENERKNVKEPIGPFTGALLPSKTRLRDVRTLAMSRPKVLLTKLSIRTSAKGNTYLSGRLGQANIVGFKATEPDKFGNECWDIFASEPEPREGTSVPAGNTYRQRQERVSAEVARGVDLDDSIAF
jgi:hypothetical protein